MTLAFRPGVREGSCRPVSSNRPYITDPFKGLEIIRCSNEVFKSVHTHASVTHGWKASWNNSIYDQIVHLWTNRSSMIKPFISDQTVHSWPNHSLMTKPFTHYQNPLLNYSPMSKLSTMTKPFTPDQSRCKMSRSKKSRGVGVGQWGWRNVLVQNVGAKCPSPKSPRRNVLFENILVRSQTSWSEMSRLSGSKTSRSKTSRGEKSGSETS